MSTSSFCDTMINPAAVISNITCTESQETSSGHSLSQKQQENAHLSPSTETAETNTIQMHSSINNNTTATTTIPTEHTTTTRFCNADVQKTQLDSRHDIDRIVSVAPSSVVSNLVKINSSLLPVDIVVVASSSSSSSLVTVQTVSASALVSPQLQCTTVEIKKCSFTNKNNIVNIDNGCSNRSNASSLVSTSIGKYTKLSERINTSDTLANALINTKSNTTMVAMHDMVNEENFSFDDTSEELQYGPGIVSKLRCRYLSLALRQSANKQRPSLDNLRRATSLNNLLDEDEENTSRSNRTSWNNQSSDTNRDQKARTPDEYVISFARKDSTDSSRCRQVSRGNDSLKRARSVEALMRYDNKAWQRDISKESNDADDDHYKQQSPVDILKLNRTSLVNGDISIEDKIINARERGEHKPKRLTSFMDETERPPPDLVKHTLRIFEASANRRMIISRLGNGDVAAKVATFKSIISHEKPAIAFPKPPLSPKKPMTKLRSNTSSSPGKQNHGHITNGKTLNSHAILKPSIDIQSIKSNLEKSTNCISNVISNVKKLPDHCRSPSPSLALRVENANAYRTNKLESPLSPLKLNLSSGNQQLDFFNTTSLPIAVQRTDTMPSELLFDRYGSDIELSSLSKKLENIHIESPLVPKLVSDSQLVEVKPSHSTANTESVDGDCTGQSKLISKTALANISKAGTTTEFKFFSPSNSVNKSHLPGFFNGSNLQTKKFTDTAEPSVRQIGIIRPQVKAIVTSPNPTVRQTNEATKCVDVYSNLDVSSNISENKLDEKFKRDNLLITNLLTTKSNCNISNIVQPLTSREIEKNLINKEKNEETASKPSSVTKATTSPQKNWQHADTQNNTMVFNFSNRKNIPDYIENDGLVFRRKRELPKVSFFFICL